MKEKRLCHRGSQRSWQKMLAVMKLFVLLTCCFTFSLSATTPVQQERVNLKMKNVSVLELFNAIQQQTKLYFLFNQEQVESIGRISVKSNNETVESVLQSVFENTGLMYEFMEKMIVIKKRTTETQQQQPKRITITGKVTDTKKEALPGVTIVIKGTKSGAVTDMNGNYSLILSESNTDCLLVFTMVGMEPVEIKYQGKNTINVVMKDAVNELEDVVITGMFTKSRESYIGAVTTIRSEDLKQAGNRNILSSIQNLDPGFNINDNPTIGSDPNSLPDITIRGNSSMTSNLKDLQSDSETTQTANMPLFIMDGFEISMERMMDMDDNQVESITLLKDAGATAMYGTRGANGVVVITTKQPKGGRLQLTYKGSLSLEVPDLATYDLLNAKEKLEYEKAAGLYTYPGGPGSNQKNLEALYNSRMLAAEQGVNTYWLKYPVQTGVGHNHSMRLEGGREEIRYAVGLSYKNVVGAMKGSERNTLNGNVFLSYKLKNLIFRNDLQISDNKSTNSPYGEFSTYAKINSYWKPYDSDGNLLMTLDDRYYTSLPTSNQSNTVYNPLYNAYLPSINESKYTQIQNNFAVEWNILPELTLRGKFSATKQNSRTDKYKPASHTDFLKYTGDNYNRRGTYKMGIGESFRYEVDFTLNFTKTWKEIHQLYTGFGYSVAQKKTESFSFQGEGIPDDYSDFIGLASAYEKNGSPYGSEGISRRAGGILNINYTYNRRYFADISGKLEGSSNFGSNNRYAPFWSAGAGWNIHQENFMKDNAVFNMVRLRVSYGTSGTQNFSPYQAMRTFRYFSSESYNGLAGVYLLGIGNSELGWQKTTQLNVGIELELFDKRIMLNADWYNKLTNDMLADITLPLSGGFGSYKANVGKVLNRGVEVSLNAYLIRQKQSKLFWSVGGTLAYNKNEIREISNSLQFLNEELIKSDGINPSFLFKEGQSMNTIFAVRSLGIDPANGKEIFLKADGETQTYEWKAADKVACGVNEPKVWGNLNTMLRFKNWTLKVVFGYRYGGQIYNSTLANKVENIRPIDNADKRVLYDRWKNPGDHAKYKSVTDLSTTYATSRFVADENTLECRSVSLGHEWTSDWLKKNLSVAYLSLTAYGEDIFRISSIKQERGINYPYSRKFSLSLSLRF